MTRDIDLKDGYQEIVVDDINNLNIKGRFKSDVLIRVKDCKN